MTDTGIADAGAPAIREGICAGGAVESVAAGARYISSWNALGNTMNGEVSYLGTGRPPKSRFVSYPYGML